MKLCILGSGLSALTLAKALANENIYVDIICPNKNYRINKSRTIGISKSNFQYLNKNIINIEEIGWKLNKIQIYSDNLKNEILLNFENNKDHLFSIVKNHKIYEILNKSLSKNKFFKKIILGKKVIKYNDYDLIINSEYNNFFTKKYFSNKMTKTYESLAYTTIIQHEKISNGTAIQIFTKNGPLAFLPISRDKTSIVYSINNSHNIKKDKINSLINKYNFKYKIKKINEIESFPLKSYSLRSYYHENILAFGDLLHKIHPLAGQGFNMTIRDINILINIIKAKIDLGLPLDKSINSQFEQKLKNKNFLFLNGIDLIYELFNFERKVSNNFLSKSIKLLGNNPSINKMFTKLADKGINF